MFVRRDLGRALRRSAVAVAALAIALTVAAPPAHATLADKRNDFTGDGISDIVGVRDDCLWLWSGTGSGRVNTAVQLSCGNWSAYEYSLATPGDIDGDGKGDLVGINGGGCLYAWPGNGRGNFGTAWRVGCGWDPYDATIAGAGDLNNDGVGDVVAINHDDDCLYRWFGNGSGGFGAGVKYGCGWGPYTFWTDLRWGTVTGAGDINGDGNADLAAINQDNGCLVRWYGNGHGGLSGGISAGCGTWSPYAYRGHLVGLGDFNGDGHGDLVGINGEGSSGDDCLYRWLGNGSGFWGGGSPVGCGGWRQYSLAT